MFPCPATLTSEGLRLCRVAEHHAAPLGRILTEPGVRRWWGSYDEPRFRREYLDGESDEVAYAIDIDGEVAGLVQFSEENEPDYRHAGIDVFLGERWQGRGYGPEAIRVIARYLLDERGHHRLTIDPAVANRHAIHAYERVGFRPVGVMRQYQRCADGSWEDALLMDLLAGELG